MTLQIKSAITQNHHLIFDYYKCIEFFFIKNKLLWSSPSISVEGAEGLGHNLLEKAQCLLTLLEKPLLCHTSTRAAVEPAQLCRAPQASLGPDTTQLKQHRAHAHMLKATKTTYKTSRDLKPSDTQACGFSLQNSLRLCLFFSQTPLFSKQGNMCRACPSFHKRDELCPSPNASPRDAAAFHLSCLSQKLETELAFMFALSHLN